MVKEAFVKVANERSWPTNFKITLLFIEFELLFELLTITFSQSNIITHRALPQTLQHWLQSCVCVHFFQIYSIVNFYKIIFYTNLSTLYCVLIILVSMLKSLPLHIASATSDLDPLGGQSTLLIWIKGKKYSQTQDRGQWCYVCDHAC